MVWACREDFGVQQLLLKEAAAKGLDLAAEESEMLQKIQEWLGSIPRLPRRSEWCSACLARIPGGSSWPERPSTRPCCAPSRVLETGSRLGQLLTVEITVVTSSSNSSVAPFWLLFQRELHWCLHRSGSCESRGPDGQFQCPVSGGVSEH